LLAWFEKRPTGQRIPAQRDIKEKVLRSKELFDVAMAGWVI
jgi:hypothetical protein